MDHNFRVGQTYYPPRPRSIVKQPASPQVQKPFDQILTQQLQAEAQSAKSLTFSQHAKARLQERGIELAPTDVGKLEDAVQKAASKGSKESLIMMDHVAYVVSIVNRKVITAIDESSMKDNLFTNIDSAIFL